MRLAFLSHGFGTTPSLGLRFGAFWLVFMVLHHAGFRLLSSIWSGAARGGGPPYRGHNLTPLTTRFHSHPAPLPAQLCCPPSSTAHPALLATWPHFPPGSTHTCPHCPPRSTHTQLYCPPSSAHTWLHCPAGSTQARLCSYLGRQCRKALRSGPCTCWETQWTSGSWLLHQPSSDCCNTGK